MILLEPGNELEQISRVRRQRESQKYLTPWGSNQADYRDSVWDIIEELADALHILELTENKVARLAPEYMANSETYFTNAKCDLQYLTADLLELRLSLPEVFSQDRIVVDRACFINREGSEMKQTFVSVLSSGDTNSMETGELP